MGEIGDAVHEHPQGATLAVRAQPGARKSGVMAAQGGRLRVAVTAPPEDGRANEALAELLSDVLGTKRGQIELIAGERNRNKVFLIRGFSPESLVTILLNVTPVR